MEIKGTLLIGISLLLLLGSVFTKPAFTCESECSGAYDLCDASCENVEQKAMCLYSKLNCMLGCSGKRLEKLNKLRK